MAGAATRATGDGGTAPPLLILVAVVAGMTGLTFASVPLYRMFCGATGFGGTTQRAAAAPETVSHARSSPCASTPRPHPTSTGSSGR